MRIVCSLFFVLLLGAVVTAGEDGPPPIPGIGPRAGNEPPPPPPAPGESVPAKDESASAAPAKDAAAADDPGGDTITVNFRDADIVSVIDYYSKMLGKTFIIDDKLKGKVTVISPGPISRAKALAMLDTILSMNGFGMVDNGEYVKIVQKDKISRDVIGELGKDTPPDRIVSEVVSMQFVPASSILEQIRPLLSQEGNIVVSEHLNTLIITDTAGNIMKIKKIVAALDQESRAMQTKVYRLSFASAEKLAASLPNLLVGGEKSGEIKPSVAVDADTNSVIITGTPLVQKRMRDLLPDLDRRKGQVLIEAKIVEVSHTVSSRFGFEWEKLGTNGNNDRTYNAGVSNYALDNKNQLAGVSGLRLSLLDTDSWTALLNAYSTTEDVNILSSPHLMAVDGQTATLHVGEEIPVLKESRVDSSNNPVNTYDYENVGIDLTIKPKLIGNGEVMLEVKQEVSSILQYNEENLTHRLGERLAETTVIVKNRNTLVIGGMLKDAKRKSTNGVPVLKNIPVLGKLFSQQGQTDSPEKTELLIFITPRLVDSPEEAKRVSEEMKESHPRTYQNSGEDFRL